MGSMQHFYIRKVVLQAANNLVQRTGRIALPGRIAYLESQYLRVHADISLMGLSKVCSPSSKYSVVKRPKGSQVQDFTNRFCFHSSKTLHDHLVLLAVDFGTALSTLFFSSSTLFGCRNISNDFVAVYILTKRQLNL